MRNNIFFSDLPSRAAIQFVILPMAEFTVEGLDKVKQQAGLKEAESKEKDKQKREAAKRSAKMAETAEKAKEKDAEQAMKRFDLIERKRKQHLIKQYFRAFPELKDVVPEPGKNASLDELQDIIELLRFERQAQGAEERMGGLVFQGAALLEGFWGDGKDLTWLPPNLRLNLVGLPRYLQSGPLQAKLDPLIKETAIEHPELCEMNLLLRWMMAIGTTLFIVSEANKQSAKKGSPAALAHSAPLNQGPAQAASS